MCSKSLPGDLLSESVCIYVCMYVCFGKFWWKRSTIAVTNATENCSLNAVSGVGSSPTLVTCETSLRVCQMFFLEIFPFSPHLLIGPSHMS